MKITLVAALSFLLLAGCGAAGRDKPAAEPLTATNDSLENSFRSYTGNFGVVSCKASRDEKNNCRHQRAELVIRYAGEFDDNVGLLLERIYKPVGPLPLPEIVTLPLVAEEWPGYKCEISKGRAHCVNKERGSSVRTTITPKTYGLAVRVEVPLQGLTLELTLQRDRP